MTHKNVMNIANKRGFLWQSFQIYSGVAGFYDYGPLGSILKNNIMNKWRKYYIVGEGFFEIEAPIVMPREALKASGHVDNFTDPMVKCENCKEVFRADHIIEDIVNKDVEGLPDEELTQIINENNIRCPECEGELSSVWSYNLMFKTMIGAKGDKIGYLRPETAQGMFIAFKRLLRFYRNKLPFGVVQLGKVYRNEISPRQGVIRLREFTQAEAEIFVNPEDKTHPKFSQILDEKLKLYSQDCQLNDKEAITVTASEAVSEGIVSSEMLAYQLYLAKKFLKEIGIPDSVLRFRQHLPTEMAHYAIDCWDVEAYTDNYGWIEIIGIADRTDYDLKSHDTHSNEELSVFMEYDEPKTIKMLKPKPNMSKFGPAFKSAAPKILEFLKRADIDEIQSAFDKDGKYIVELEENYELTPEFVTFEEIDETIRGEKIFPHVIEPSFGVDRIIYSVLLNSYVEDGERSLFKFEPSIAPIQVNVFPLLNKKELINIALDINDDLRNNGFITEFDTSGTIGRRYARGDEIGVPYSVTVDYDTIEDQTVTIRNRDDTIQYRVSIEDVSETIGSLLKKEIQFEDLN